MPSRLPIGPILRIACSWSRKSSRVNWLPAASFAAIASASSSSKCCCGLLDQGEHVAHAEDARGHPVGVEDVEVLELLAVGGEHDRLAGDLAHRQRGAAAGVAVELGEHDAGEADAVAERLGGVDGVLADHRVDDEQHFLRVDRRADVRGLLHHLGVDAEPAGGVDDDHVVLGPAGELDRVAGDLHRVADAVARLAARRTATPARSPTICSWLTAFGRCRSQATSSGVWPCPRSQRASLPASVVLPEPCRPASMITVGGCLA